MGERVESEFAGESAVVFEENSEHGEKIPGRGGASYALRVGNEQWRGRVRRGKWDRRVEWRTGSGSNTEGVKRKQPCSFRENDMGLLLKYRASKRIVADTWRAKRRDKIPSRRCCVLTAVFSFFFFLFRGKVQYLLYR